MADIEKNTAEAVEAKADKGDKKPEKKAKSDKAPLGQRMKSWFKGFKAEWKKIVWVAPKQVLKNTCVVLVCVAVVAIILAVLDYVFSTAFVELSILL